MPTIELPTLILHAVVTTAESSRVVLVNRDPAPEETGVPIDSTLALEIVDLGPAGLSLAETFQWAAELRHSNGGRPAPCPSPSGAVCEPLDCHNGSHFPHE
jgi:hypothetical protein